MLGQGRRRERLGYAIGLGGDAPEGVEDPVEKREVLGPAREDGAQSGADLVAVGQIEVLERAHAVGDVLRRDGHAVPA